MANYKRKENVKKGDLANEEVEPVFKSGVDHGVNWRQCTRGDPVPGG